MFILMVLENYLPDIVAGTERYVHNLASGLVQSGVRVAILRASVGGVYREYEVDGLSVYALPVPERVSTAEMNGLRRPSSAALFRDALKRLNPDIVHFHSFSRSVTPYHLKMAHEHGTATVFTAHVAGVFCARADFRLMGEKPCNGLVRLVRCTECYMRYRGRVRWVPILSRLLTMLTYTPLRRFRPALNIVKYHQKRTASLLRYADRVIAIAPWMREVYRGNGVTQVSTIEQHVDTKNVAVKKGVIANRRLRVVYVGRMEKIKGFDLLLEACRGLNEHVDIRVATPCSQPVKDYFKALKSKYFALGFHDWRENLDDTELRALLAKSDVLCVPSYTEVAPLVIHEAFAAGLPVIGSDIPAISDYVDHGVNGLLFAYGSSQDLRNKLLTLCEEHSKVDTLSRNVRAKRKAGAIVKEHLSLYSQVWEEKCSTRCKSRH